MLLPECNAFCNGCNLRIIYDTNEDAFDMKLRKYLYARIYLLKLYHYSHARDCVTIVH